MMIIKGINIKNKAKMANMIKLWHTKGHTYHADDKYRCDGEKIIKAREGIS